MIKNTFHTKVHLLNTAGIVHGTRVLGRGRENHPLPQVFFKSHVEKY
jgi:hypothetical protein